MKKRTATLPAALLLIWLSPVLAQDGDGIPFPPDNCPTVDNSDQLDSDYDGRGDACDNCDFRYNPNQANDDGDAFGNVCDASPGTNDLDGDGVINTEDNCPFLENPDQGDFDNDSIGDLCDVDFKLWQVASFNNPNQRLPLVDGMIVPPGYFGSNGELLIAITGIHQLVENAVTGTLGSIPVDRSPAELRFTVSGGPTRPVAEWQNNPPFGMQLVYFTNGYQITVPQQLRADAQAGDAVLQLSLLIEMTTDGGATWRSADFSSVSVIDGRDIEQETNQTVTDRPLSLQVTTAGIEKLGFTLQSSQPLPDMDAFNEALQSDVPLFAEERSNTTSALTCVPLTSFPEFKRLPSWPRIRDEARALYATYQSTEATVCSDELQTAACAGTAAAVVSGAVLAGPAGAVTGALASLGPAAHCEACRAMERWCTKDSWPVDDDFEVCIGEVSGRLVSHSVGELSDMRLTVSEDVDNRLLLDAAFSDVDARVDISFSNFSIRYTEGANNCLFRPEVDVPQSEIDNNPTIASQFSCPNAQVYARRACSSCAPDFPAFPDLQTFPESFALAISQADPETFVAAKVGDATLMLQDVEANLPGNTVCTDPTAPGALADEAETLLETFYAETFDLLNYTWARDWSYKSRADNITDLFSPLHTGVAVGAYASDDLQFIDLSLNAADGLIAKQSVNVESGIISFKPRASTLYKGTEFGEAVYLGGTSPLGDFDVQQTLNLAYLNRRIAAAYQNIMAVTVYPTWQDLGIAPPPGVPAEQRLFPDEMTGDNLGQWNPLFLPLGSTPLRFSAEVPVLPFTWMEPDYVTPVAPIFFEIPRVVLTVTDEKGNVLGRVAGHYEASVAFTLSGFDFDNNADGFPVGGWQFAIADSLDLPGCTFKDALAGDACVASFTSAMESMFEKTFATAFDEFFGYVRSPAVYTQSGDATIPAEAVPLSPEDQLASYGHSSQLATLNYNLGPDSDGDGVPDLQDNCVDAQNVDQLDSDNDRQGDACDGDDDNDGHADEVDLCPLIASSQSDMDSDGKGDECDLDIDGDDVLNFVDNCPVVFNPDQANSDFDRQGNACDDDTDNDGVDDGEDNCPNVRNRDQLDINGNGIGDLCDPDIDGDAVPNQTDNCPYTENAEQLDFDLDGAGNDCDRDFDNDGVYDDQDNCPYLWNMLQEDSDGDGIGDNCADPATVDSDGDGILDADDDFPYQPVAFRDTDSDGQPDQVLNSCKAACRAAMGLTEDRDDDDDGFEDEEELDYGTDALNPNDFPAASGVNINLLRAAFCARKPNHQACQ